MSHIPNSNREDIVTSLVLTRHSDTLRSLTLIKGIELPVSEYTIYYIYTLQEILTISAFIVYLALFAPDIFAIGRSLQVQRVSPQAAGR